MTSTRNKLIDFILIPGLLLLTSLSSSVYGGEAENEGDNESYEHHGKHALGPFIGITREHGHNRETIGIEYSYRLNRRWSVGAVIERAERDKDSTLAIIFAHFWPYKELYLGLGIGRKNPGEERENTIRGTIGYEFELGGGWGIGPQANLDVIENESNEEAYGIVIGKRF